MEDNSMRMRTGCIYGLFTSDTSVDLDCCRYIGKTVQKPNARLSYHKTEARRGDDMYRHRWIRSVWARGADIIMVILEEHSEMGNESMNKRLNEREIAWIARGRAEGWALTNLTEGGDGLLGHTVSDETKAKISAANTGHPVTDEMRQKMRGRVVSEETRQKLSVAKKGKKQSPEAIAKTAAANKGNKHAAGKRSPDVRANMSAARIGNTNSLGYKHTEESKARMSEAQRLNWVKRRAKKEQAENDDG